MNFEIYLEKNKTKNTKSKHFEMKSPVWVLTWFSGSGKYKVLSLDFKEVSVDGSLKGGITTGHCLCMF